MIITTVKTIKEAQLVREIRNRVRDNMTGSNKFITEDEQEKWFNEVYALNDDTLFLFYTDKHSVLGYGYLRFSNGRWYATLAVNEEFRGLGYGTKVYEYLIQQCQAKELWIEIFSDNNPSLRAALAAGFKIKALNDTTITLVKD